MLHQLLTTDISTIQRHIHNHEQGNRPRVVARIAGWAGTLQVYDVRKEPHPVDPSRQQQECRSLEGLTALPPPPKRLTPMKIEGGISVGQPVDIQALATDQSYYALEFSSIPRIYTHDRVKAFILHAYEYEKHLIGVYDHGKQQAIEDIERSYPTAIKVLLGRIDAAIIRRKEERKATCTHENGILSLYDKHQADYTLEAGKPVANNEDFEPELLYEVDFCCPQCDTIISYPDWREAPEPIRTYASHCFHMESAT